ncbi:hypothetical protein BBJ29_009630 [Phytophthora kernoviae]|uniref:WW domain-containing protein n=1 Tax=Phytophthora kernoviae TaxID=325452 RepID=A0A3R7JJ51_9STRA|nr:hypothetical protein BBJ29_009630 [Phytophthora kernoviae]
MVSIPSTFKAYEYYKFGDAMEEVKLNTKVAQKPLKANEVRVKIISAAVNPVDYKLVQYGPMILPTAPTAENPFRVGFDMSGKVVEIGSDVKNYQVGDEVFSMPGLDSFGTFGEYLNVQTKYLAHKPSSLTFNEAAGVPLAGQTSWQALVTYGKLQAGQRVLILGGSSGTGIFAIQMAKALGAEVITTSSFRNTELVKSLGADQVIDYTKETWSEVLTEHSVDLIYDCGVEPASWNDAAQKVLKKQSGIFVTILTVDKPIESPIGATFHQIFNKPCTEFLLEVKKLIDAGKVKVIIDSVHPLENLMEAFKVQKSSRAKGKIVIEVTKDSPEFQEALRDHAKNLGVDPGGESYLLPLVQEALLAELPPDWEQGETEDGTLYYFNPSTEESIWEHPLDAHYRELIQTKIREHDAETQQGAKESNYLKMKINELKGNLADQESAASAREKQQLDNFANQESSASAREKQHADKLAKLETENARLVKQQNQTQSEQMEANQKEAQQSRKALENKQEELDELQKRLTEQQHSAKTALDAHEKAQAELSQKLAQQEMSAEALKRQHDSEIANLREQLEKLEQQLHSSKTTADEQAAKCEHLEKLQQELRTLKSATDDQAYKSEQLEKLQQELRTLRSTTDEQAATKSEQLEKLQKELRMLKGTADDQASKCQRLEAVQEDLVKEEKLRREVEEKNRTLQAQVDRLEWECAEVNRKHTGLVQDIDAKKAENTTLQTTLFKAQDELRTLNSSFEQQRYQQQLTLERERIASDTETQAQSRIQKLQTQLTAQLDEQTAARTKLQTEVLELRGELASIQVQELKPLEKLRDQLQRELERTTERASMLEKDLRSARQELSGQTDRANQMEIEVDVLVRREQQRKAQMDALNTAKIAVEKQLDTLQDELLTAQHDKRIDVDKLNFRVRDLESQVSQKEYETARLEERFAKAETWRSKEAARVEKRDAQLLELREQFTALQSRHVEVESSAEIQELRATKQKAEVKIQQLERDLGDERDGRKRDEIQRTEDLQRMQQAVEWQLPQLAQACVTRSSDEWARKCRAVAKKLRDELSMRALQERNELVEREHKAHEACERTEQKLKTTVAESEFLRREVGRLEDNNKVLLEQLHTIRVYLTQRPHATSMGSAPWNWPGNPPPAPNQAASTTTAATAAVGGPLGGPAVPLGGFTDFSTVNQLNTQLGILHAQFQQLFDVNDQRRRSPMKNFSPSYRFEIPTSPTAQSRALGKDEQRREAEEDAEVQQLAMEALMDQKLAASNSNSLNTTRSSSASLHRQQEELLTTLESLGEVPKTQWLPVYSPRSVGSCPDGVESGQEQPPHSTLWYQQDYWRSKYQ